ncbi:hypothetical protein HNQ51_002452 [Inhella inkyongensis]|uniref:Uncharacterized protein n=1 Tax=Inhella inkyongensis TaxID=392593 RepID=A0A840S609_9BURK|nr:hypothetical protein [Inhella inkyongensis]MBB5205133.1 hypothetical protein [Inhella inkyongensis]
MRPAFVLLLIGCLFATPALAEPSQSKSPFHGVWNGSIGKLSIRACFNDDIEGRRSASYYYHRHLIPIELRAEGDSATNTSATWREADGILQIESTSSDQIKGTWRSTDDSRKLAVQLTRVALSAADSADGMNPCGSNAYNEAIVASVKTIHGPVVSVGNVKYRIVTDALPSGRGSDYKGRQQYWETIELLGNNSAIAAINKSIRERIEKQGQMGLSCRSIAMNDTAGEGIDFQEVGVAVVGRWISVTRQSVVDCRQSSIHLSERTYTWDLTTGKQESLFSWIKGAEAVNDGDHLLTEGKLPDALDNFIASRFGQGDPGVHLSMDDLERCYGQHQPGSYSYQLKLASDGIVFEIPTTSNGSCGEAFKLSWKELKPFLNRKGRQFAAEIQSLQRAKR